eukprot:m.23981 g.23981  ORF g.23981 m.23981 type:complete len:555 (-) comp5602_c1_seq1:95-1759(-)
MFEEADLPCCICWQTAISNGNDMLKCSVCKIVVHQKCYGVEHVPNHAWYCKRCEPHSQVRASKKKCSFCPMKEGCIKQTKSGAWSHIVCALFIDELSFIGDFRDSVDDAFLPSSRLGKANCTICQNKNRSNAHVGASVKCVFPGCQKRMHATCAHGMKLTTLEHDASGFVFGSVVLCSQHKSKMVEGGDHETSKKSSKLATSSSSPSSATSSRRQSLSAKPKVATKNTPKKAKHGKDGSFICEICDREFLSVHGYAAHFRNAKHQALVNKSATKQTKSEDQTLHSRKKSSPSIASPSTKSKSSSSLSQKNPKRGTKLTEKKSKVTEESTPKLRASIVAEEFHDEEFEDDNEATSNLNVKKRAKKYPEQSSQQTRLPLKSTTKTPNAAFVADWIKNDIFVDAPVVSKLIGMHHGTIVSEFQQGLEHMTYDESFACIARVANLQRSTEELVQASKERVEKRKALRKHISELKKGVQEFESRSLFFSPNDVVSTNPSSAPLQPLHIAERMNALKQLAVVLLQKTNGASSSTPITSWNVEQVLEQTMKAKKDNRSHML